MARDDRPWGSTSPPGVVFTYAPGRGGQHAERILQGFGGILQVDGYAGYNRMIAADRIGQGIQLAHCWAHARRKLIEITRSGPAPIAEEGVALIRDLYAIEAGIRGSDPATRLAIRQERSVPILVRMDNWLAHHRARASAKSPLGEALAYIAKYRDGLGRFLTYGRVEIDNNTVERTIRPIALNRKNALFAGHDAGAENWAVIASLIETCEMNRVDPYAWLANTLTSIVNGHKPSRCDRDTVYGCSTGCAEKTMPWPTTCHNCRLAATSTGALAPNSTITAMKDRYSLAGYGIFIASTA